MIFTIIGLLAAISVPLFSIGLLFKRFRKAAVIGLSIALIALAGSVHLDSRPPSSNADRLASVKLEAGRNEPRLAKAIGAGGAELENRASSTSTQTALGACQKEANAVARQIGATAERYAGNMVAMTHDDLGETTWGCSPNPFLVMFARPQQSLADFLTAVGSAGQSLLGEERQRVTSLADRCVRDAMASADGNSRTDGKNFTLDCGAGRNGLNPKVTIEMPTMPSGVPQ